MEEEIIGTDFSDSPRAKKTVKTDFSDSPRAKKNKSADSPQESPPKSSASSTTGGESGAYVKPITPSTPTSASEGSESASWTETANTLKESKPITASQTKGAERTFPISSDTYKRMKAKGENVFEKDGKFYQTKSNIPTEFKIGNVKEQATEPPVLNKVGKYTVENLKNDQIADYDKSIKQYHVPKIEEAQAKKKEIEAAVQAAGGLDKIQEGAKNQILSDWKAADETEKTSTADIANYQSLIDKHNKKPAETSWQEYVTGGLASLQAATAHAILPTISLGSKIIVNAFGGTVPEDNVIDNAIKYHDAVAESYPLPKTMFGKVEGAVVSAIPLIYTMGMIKNPSGNYISHFKNLATVMGTQEGAEKFNEAYKQSTGNMVESYKGLAEGFVQGVGNAAKLELEMGVGKRILSPMISSPISNVINKVKPKVVNTETVKNLADRTGDALGVGLVFSGTSAFETALEKGQIDSEEALTQFFTGIAFEAPALFGAAKKVSENIADGKKADAKSEDILNEKSLESGLNLFFQSENADIEKAANTNISVEDLKQKALETGLKVQEPNELNKKISLLYAQIGLQNLANLKRIAELAKNNPMILNKYIDKTVSNIEEANAMKQKVLDVFKMLDPKEREITKLSNEIAGIDNAIKEATKSLISQDAATRVRAELAVKELSKLKESKTEELRNLIMATPEATAGETIKTTTNEKANEDGEQKRGKDGEENVPKSVQSEGEDGGNEVDLKEKQVLAPEGAVTAAPNVEASSVVEGDVKQNKADTDTKVSITAANKMNASQNRYGINVKGDNVGFIVTSNPIDNIVKIKGIEVKEKLRGKGIAGDAYIKLGEELSNKGITLVSDNFDTMEQSAVRVWEKLVNKGYAEKTKDVYKFKKQSLKPKTEQQTKPITNEKSSQKTDQEGSTEEKEVEAVEGSTVKLPPSMKGGMERTMVFKDGEWQQSIGGSPTKVGEKVKAEADEAFKASKKAEPTEVITETETTPTVEAPKVEAKEEAPTQEEVKQQIANFGVAPEMVEPVHNVITQVFEGLKKAGLTVAKTVGDWVGIGKGQNSKEALKISYGAFEKVGFEETAEYQKLKASGHIKEGFDIKSIGGKPVVIINPDNMITGQILSKDGKSILDANGGIHFVSKFGDVWASSDKSTASTLAKYINAARELDIKNGGDGIVHIVVTKGTLGKSLTSHNGAKGAMSVLEFLANKELIDAQELRAALKEVSLMNDSVAESKELKTDIDALKKKKKSLEKKGKVFSNSDADLLSKKQERLAEIEKDPSKARRKYDFDFSGGNSIEDINKDIHSKFFGVKDSSFKKRGFFVMDVINHLAKNGVSVHNNLDGIKDALNTKEIGRDIKFGEAGIRDAIGNLFADQMTQGVPNSHAYATIEISKPVEVIEGKHESYPFHIKQVGGERPILNILSEQKHIKDIANPKEGSTNLGSNQVGMAEASMKSATDIESLKQRANAQYRIESGKNIIEAIKNFDGSPKAVTAIAHEIMHPTVVAIIDGAKEGNETGAKHTQTIIDEFNKANPNSKITVEQLIAGNDAFKEGTTSKEYRAVQEFIAESWEKYHTEGAKGFSKAFQEVLEQITQAFKAVYKGLTGEKLTPELRQMFDEILGKEAQKVEAKEEEVTPTQEEVKQEEEEEQYEPITVSGTSHDTFTKDNAVDYEEDEREGDNGRSYTYLSSVTVELIDDNSGDTIGTISKLKSEDGEVTYSAEDADGNLVAEEVSSKAEAQQAVVNKWNKQKLKEFNKEKAAEKKAKAKEAKKKAEKEAANAKPKTEKEIAKEKLDAKLKEIDLRIEREGIEDLMLNKPKQNGFLSAKGLAVAVERAMAYMEYTGVSVKEAVKNVIDYFKSKGINYDEEDISNIENALIPKQGKVAIRKSELSEVQNTFKNAPKSFAQMTAEGLANVAKGKGESMFDATKRTVDGIYSRIKNKEKVVLNTDQTAEVGYYFSALKSKVADIATEYSEGKITYAEMLERSSGLKDSISKVEELLGSVGQEQARAFVMRQSEFVMTRDQKLKVFRMEVLGKAGGESDNAKIRDYYEKKIKEEFDRQEDEKKALKKRIEELEKQDFNEAVKQRANQKGKEQRTEIEIKKAQASKVIDKAKKDLTKFLDDWHILSKGDDVQNNPVNFNKLIDKVFETAKVIANTGIEIEAAIKQVVDMIKGHKVFNDLSKEDREALVKNVTDKFSKKPTSIPNSILKEAYEAIGKGKETEIEDIVAYIKDKYYPDMTEREVRDAITNYAKVITTSTEDIDVTLRKAKRVGLLLTKLEVVREENKRPKSTGLQRDELQQRERNLQKELNEAMKDLPIDEKRKEGELASTQSRIKKYLENRIEDLKKYKEDGKRPDPSKPIEYNQENKDLQAQVKQLEFELKQLLGKKEIPLEDRIKKALINIEKSEAKWERKAKEGDFTTEKKEQLSTPEIEAAKAKRDARKKEFDKLKAEAMPKPVKSDLQSLVERQQELTKKINEAKDVKDAKTEQQLKIEKEATEGEINDLLKFLHENKTPQENLNDAIESIKNEAVNSGATNVTNKMVKDGLVDDLVDAIIKNGGDYKNMEIDLYQAVSSILPDATISDLRKAFLKIDQFKQQTTKQVVDWNKQAESEARKISKARQDISDLMEFKEVLKRGQNNPKVVSQYLKTILDRKKQFQDEINETKRSAKSDAKAKEKLAELDKKMTILNGRQEAWTKIDKNPKKVDELLRNKREELKKTLENNGIKIGGETIKNRAILKAIGERNNERLVDLKEIVNNAAENAKSITEKEIIQKFERAINKVDFSSAENMTDQLRKVDKMMEQLSEDMDIAGLRDLRNATDAVRESMKKEIEVAKVNQATENFIKNAERKISQNKRDMAAGKFEEKESVAPRVTAETVKAEKALRISKNNIQRLADRYEYDNSSTAKKFASSYINLRTQMLISGLFTYGKLGVSALTRPVIETTTRGLQKINPLDYLFTRNIRKGLGSEGISLRSIGAAHAGVLHPFRTEADIQKLREKATIDFEQTMAEYEANPSPENIKKFRDASMNYATSFIYDFIGANGTKELIDTMRGKLLRLEEVFGTEKGMKAEDIKTHTDRMMFVAELFGKTHAAIKNFSGRAEFARAFVSNIENGVKRGEDITNPNQILIYAARSLGAHQEGTYQQENKISKWLNQSINNFEKAKADESVNMKNFREFVSMLYKIQYPIQKTPLNIYAEALVDYTLGLPLAMREHAIQTKIAFNETALDSPDFKREWAKVADKIAELPSEVLDRINKGYRKGGAGAIMMTLAALGYISINDDDEYTVFGMKMSKTTSRLISHIPLFMPAQLKAKFDNYIEEEDKKGNKYSSNEAWKKTGKDLIHETPYGHTTSANQWMSSLVPLPRFAGDIASIGENPKHPKTITEAWKVTTGWGRNDVIDRGSVADKMGLSKEDLNNKDVVEFKQQIEKSAEKYTKEEIEKLEAEFAKEIKDLNRQVEKGLVKETQTQKALIKKKIIDNFKHDLTTVTSEEKLEKALGELKTTSEKANKLKDEFAGYSKIQKKWVALESISTQENKIKELIKKGIIDKAVENEFYRLMVDINTEKEE